MHFLRVAFEIEQLVDVHSPIAPQSSGLNGTYNPQAYCRLRAVRKTRTVGPVRGFLVALVVALVGCDSTLPWTPIQDTDTEARNVENLTISWRENLIDDQTTSGVPLRGPQAFALGNLDGDGQPDIVTAYKGSRYLRVAYSMPDPAEKFLLTLAESDDALGLFDVAIGDIDGDGWQDVVAAGVNGILYVQNPGQSKPGFRWQRIYPTVAKSAWLTIDLVDLNGDGKLEIVGLKPFAIGEFPAMVRLVPGANPLDAEAWTEEALANQQDAAFAVPGDLDGDGDTDFFSGAGAGTGVLWFRNISKGSAIALEAQSSLVEGFTGEIYAPTLADFDGDSRLDVAAALDAGLVVVFTQGPSTSQAWSYRTVGDVGLDGVAGLAAADIDGDGDMDLMVGSRGVGPSETDKDVSPESVDIGAPAGRIAWLQNPGSGTGEWIRHDIFRRERGRFGALLPTDADGDGDTDFIGVRSNSGDLDGLFWLQQLHSPDAVVRFLPARRASSDSLALPLP